MEYSAFELFIAMQSLMQTNDTIKVLCHEDTAIDPQIKVVAESAFECDEDYEKFGDGAYKWNILATEMALFRSLTSASRFDIIVDQSSALAPVMVANTLSMPVVKTIRLMPYHPAYRLATLPGVSFVHLTDFSRSSAHVLEGNVIRDYIGVPCDLAHDLAEIPSEYAVSVGRVEPRKGHLEAASYAAKHKMNLLVIGRISNVEYAELLSAKYSNVTILGGLDRNSALALVKRAQLTIWTPTIPEPNGRVVVESLRLGVPVVGRKLGAIHDIVRERNLSPCEGDLYYVDALPANWPSSSESVAAEYLRLMRGKLLESRNI